jgi:hypothetical protein
MKSLWKILTPAPIQKKWKKREKDADVFFLFVSERALDQTPVGQSSHGQ